MSERQKTVLNDSADMGGWVERTGIDAVPETQREGSLRGQFALRFMPGVYLAPIVVGGIGVASGLGLWSTLMAIILANLAAGAVVGACQVMGPDYGVPQLTLSRMAFGITGNKLPSIMAIPMFIGYFAVGIILSAEAFQAFNNDIPYTAVLIISGIAAIIITAFGYKMLSLVSGWVTMFTFIALLITTGFALTSNYEVAERTLVAEKYWATWANIFMIGFAITGAWCVAASDLSRYMPRKTPKWQLFFSSGLGVAASYGWLMCVGAIMMSLIVGGDANTSNVFEAFNIIMPSGFAKVLLLILAISSIPHSSANQYAGDLSILAAGAKIPRVFVSLLTGVVGLVLAYIFGGTKFQSSFEAFLIMVTYFIMPWFGVIAADYYVVRRRNRNWPTVAEFYDVTGRLGGIKWSGIIAMLVGIVSTIPLMNSPLYVGPIGDQLGLDISAAIGPIVAGIVYIILERKHINGR